MIRFSLNCEHAHQFEIWFASNDDFDRQRARKLVACPSCGSTNVEKALMAPAIATSRRRGSPGSRASEAGAVGAGSDTTKAAGASAPMAVAGAIDPRKAEMIKAVREVVRQVRAQSEDVGDRFPEEARRIHHGEAEERGIIGRASLEDAKALIEEGIEIAPLPTLPEDLN
ncbi:DUF1178 family protein [Pseudohoeflea coraliihabitans]|uniref:DUF1178 family protein n=1 Tax=Pseudohoeflea coraliihabitans TaxID=2860393 RepID=A0ABS6WKJ5_9HYPH|nr:DUF1178 family protein [Pseudohoeflea sp. DP4N28-3]MBW3096471.1 DUF1178 family protein [Pseudohoeflea sp. DP4N28-3]